MNEYEIFAVYLVVALSIWLAAELLKLKNDEYLIALLFAALWPMITIGICSALLFIAAWWAANKARNFDNKGDGR